MGKEFRNYWLKVFGSERDKATYEWWRAKLLTYGLNEACKNIYTNSLNVGDESMSAIRFWTTTKGNLPHLSYIFRKTKPMGTDFKKFYCYVTGALLLIELQKGK